MTAKADIPPRGGNFLCCLAARRLLTRPVCANWACGTRARGFPPGLRTLRRWPGNAVSGTAPTERNRGAPSAPRWSGANCPPTVCCPTKTADRKRLLRERGGLSGGEIGKVQENRHAQQDKPQEMKDKDTDNQNTVILYFLADNDVSRLRLPLLEEASSGDRGGYPIVQTDFNQNPYFCRTFSIAGLRGQVVRHSSARAAASSSPPCIWLNIFKRLP